MNLDLGEQLQLLDTVEHYFKPEFDALPLEGEGFHIYNDFFGPVDAEMAYSLIRLYAPSRVIEVGSGYSTLLMAMALVKNLVPYHLTAIDPEPRAAIAGLDVTFLQEPVQDVPLALFETLQHGDVLFIDSSHIYEPDSDVDFLYNHVLPTLASGVIVHVHDIFLPKSYPPWWDGRAYNEQDQLVRTLETGQWEVIWGSYFMNLNARQRMTQVFRSYRERDYPGSFWMRKL